MDTNFVQRWVAILDKDDIKDLENEQSLIVVLSYPHPYNADFEIAILEPISDDINLTVDDILTMTGALAVHEEYTNAVVTHVDCLDVLSQDMYTWQGSGLVLIGDLLTKGERINFILKYYNEDNTSKVVLDNLYAQVSKDTPFLPLKDCLDKLDKDEIYKIRYEQGVETALWWPTFLVDSGMFLVVLDDDLLEDEDYDDFGYKKIYGYDSIDEYYEDIYWRKGLI